MRIERVVIRNLRALVDRDDQLSGPDGIWSAACLRGVNGSGKTTYLMALAQLWQWFRRSTKVRDWTRPEPHSLLQEADLVAAKFTGLPGPHEAMWIAWGDADALSTLPKDEMAPSIEVVKGSPRWSGEILEWWDKASQQAEVGRTEPGSEPVPNIILIEAENRWVPQFRKTDLLSQEQAPASVALARYLPEARRPSHLEGLLGTIKLVDEERWKQLADWVKTLLPGLELHGFQETTRRPLFRLSGSGRTITVDRLSAGERSVLINLTMILRWKAPGGLILIDEPELHQHLSLMRGSVAVLEKVAAEGAGQLLVASHAPEVWDHFRARDAFIRLAGRDNPTGSPNRAESSKERV